MPMKFVDVCMATCFCLHGDELAFKLKIEADHVKWTHAHYRCRHFVLLYLQVVNP